MTAANTPITNAIELASWPASLLGALVVAAAVGAEDVPLALALDDVLAWMVVPGARVVAEMVGELEKMKNECGNTRYHMEIFLT
jgi:prepilin signal peptidase PulO-like enzyme (type II secretory pathway)